MSLSLFCSASLFPKAQHSTGFHLIPKIGEFEVQQGGEKCLSKTACITARHGWILRMLIWSLVLDGFSLLV